MNITLKDRLFYVIFNTEWGFFGLAGSQNKLFRTVLPSPNKKIVKNLLLNGFENVRLDINFHRLLQQRIKAFFDGIITDFNDVPVQTSQFSQFNRQVLTACRDITPAKTITYGQLAKQIGHPGASRAVGTALSQNPLPLIIPCHRVIRSDGSMGGFTAPGGTKMKSKLIQHEFVTKCRKILQYA
jgi:methylated-DNA-[protein]-cysteine S-methyltransferase